MQHFTKVKVPVHVRFNTKTGKRLDTGGTFTPPQECPVCRRKISKPLLQGKKCPECKRAIPQACKYCSAPRVNGAMYCCKCGSGQFVAKGKERRIFKVCPLCQGPGSGDRCNNQACNGSLMVGSVVKGQGRIFTVQGFLGKGAMGMVYRVTDVAGQELALKEIRPLTSTAVMDPELLFQNEVQSMAILKRFPEIVKIKGSFNDGHARFVVMEFLKGQTLEDLLLKGALPNKQAWQILLQLVQAVAPIQQLAVLRDLKASNVMIVQNQVRLFDLGFVHMLNSGSFRFPSGLVLGTPGYGSPEQFGRHVLSDFSQQVRQSDPSFYWRINLPDPYPDVLPAFDVHALGAIGYYLMTGHDPSQALYNWNWSNVDYRVRGVLHRATDLNLRNRYRDATEMLQAMVSMGGVY